MTIDYAPAMTDGLLQKISRVLYGDCDKIRREISLIDMDFIWESTLHDSWKIFNEETRANIVIQVAKYISSL